MRFLVRTGEWIVWMVGLVLVVVAGAPWFLDNPGRPLLWTVPVFWLGVGLCYLGGRPLFDEWALRSQRQ